LQAKGDRFESDNLHQIYAGVAQLVEHFLAKEDVVSSNLITRSKQYIPGVNGSMTVSKTAGGGSNPSGYAKQCEGGREAQCNSLQNCKAVGSNPTLHSSIAPMAKLVKAALSKGVS